MHPLRRHARLATVLSLALVAGVAHAVPGQDPVAYEGRAPRDFPAQVAAIEAGMQAGGPWAGLDAREKDRVRKLLASMEGVLSKHRSAADLTPNQKVQVFNAQEEANAILTGRPVRERMECSRVKRTGSRIGHEIQCEVVALDDDRRFHESDVIRRAGVKPLIGD
jgi:hypothetical protein